MSIHMSCQKTQQSFLFEEMKDRGFSDTFTALAMQTLAWSITMHTYSPTTKFLI